VLVNNGERHAVARCVAVCVQAALRARDAGSTRFCMGAAWRGPSQVGPRQWERVLEMVRRIRGLGMEVGTREWGLVMTLTLNVGRVVTLTPITSPH
jgi:biotin synthase-like enzyme